MADSPGAGTEVRRARKAPRMTYKQEIATIKNLCGSSASSSS